MVDRIILDIRTIDRINGALECAFGEGTRVIETNTPMVFAKSGVVRSRAVIFTSRGQAYPTYSIKWEDKRGLEDVHSLPHPADIILYEGEGTQ